jgi:hypothetical protein
MRMIRTLVATALVAGCAGSIDDPRQYTDASLMFECDPAIDVQRDIVQPRCGSCHGALAPAGNLDMVSPEIGERLYGVAASTCKDQVLVDVQNVFWGFLFEKVASDDPTCGTQMPMGEPALTQAELDCLHLWLASEYPESLK